VKETHFGVSDDLKHDAVFVFHALREKVLKNLADRGINVDALHVWSDGCSAQFKCKNTFLKISSAMIPITWNYHPTGHGKDECDAEGGRLKHALTACIVQGDIEFSRAKECVEYLQDSTFLNPMNEYYGEANCTAAIPLRQRVFHLIGDKEVKHDELPNMTSIKGTRSFHQMKSNGRLGGTIYSRPESCYCGKCIMAPMESTCTDCHNKHNISAWTLQDIEGELEDYIEAEVVHVAQQVESMLQKGPVLAVVAPEEDATALVCFFVSLMGHTHWLMLLATST
jgi:hypothetical protein